jgi:SAM-dependent methyltransferase
VRPRLYAEPALYDLIHAAGTDDEVWLLDRIAGLHGTSGLRSALEPACGTGRYLAGLLRRGWTVEGYDLSADMARYAAARLKKYGKRAVVKTGDMRTYKTARLVFNLLSTFRHLMNDKDALAHLRRCASSLAPGGVMVLGMDLALYGKDEPDEETWTERGMNHVMMTLPPERRARRERIMNFVTVPRRKVIESHYDLRSYDAREFAALLAKSPLELRAAYGYDGKPAELGGPERALWFVLGAKR